MIEKIIFFDCAMLILDFVTIGDLRKFLLDFLRVKKSGKQTDRVYTNQTPRNKLTLSFINDHLKIFRKEFQIFHKLYLAVLYTLIPQYVMLVICNVLLGLRSMYVLCFFAVIKLIICFIIRIHMDSNRVSVYRKK